MNGSLNETQVARPEDCDCVGRNLWKSVFISRQYMVLCGAVFIRQWLERHARSSPSTSQPTRKICPTSVWSHKTGRGVYAMHLRRASNGTILKSLHAWENLTAPFVPLVTCQFLNLIFSPNRPSGSCLTVRCPNKPKQTHKEVKHTPSLTFTLEMSNQYFNTIDKSNSQSYRCLI